MPEVEVRHPLLLELRDFDNEAARMYPGGYDEGLGELGLLLSKDLAHGGYRCTPLNTLSFGRTGGNGIHFSFIVDNAVITEEAPVVVTYPEGGNGRTYVVAEDLRSFLRTGIAAPFNVHESLPEFLRTGRPQWRGVWRENAARMRDAMASRFNLAPLIYSLEDLTTLQGRFRPMLVYPPGRE